MKVYCVLEHDSVFGGMQEKVKRGIKKPPPKNESVVVVERYNCNECKHKIACLVEPECKRTFEGVVCRSIV